MLRPIAFYLPQYHPIPENDLWWGTGFTEWTNVVKAKPLYNGHYQPHLPADLGFYDLRLSEVREAQARMAKEYGLHGFCYYHYWFNGKTLLERPFNEVFTAGKPDFPFMLCWANENWTRTWDGADHQVLMEQKHSLEDDIAHIRYLLPFFKDPRYIRIEDKPVFVVYKPNLLPDIKKTISYWREECKKEGIELYLCRVDNITTDLTIKPSDQGFDAAIDFAPFGVSMQNNSISDRSIWNKVRNKLSLATSRLLYNKHQFEDQLSLRRGKRSYKEVVDAAISSSLPDYKIFPSACPSWDNSARKSSGYFILDGSTPEEFERWLRYIVKNFKPFSRDENLVFINAWNEWGEGNHLEPCKKWGFSYLEVVKKVFQEVNG